MIPLHRRLQMAMERRPDLRPVDIARACKVKTASVADWRNGKTKSLKPEVAVLAARLFGCSQNWIGSGIGEPQWVTHSPNTPPLVAEPTPPYGVSLPDALELVGTALAALPPERRAEVGDAMRQWAVYGGRDLYRSTVLALLVQPPAASKRAGA